MLIPGPHSRERERLDALVALELLDTPPDPELDTITRIASLVFGVPTSTVTLVDDRRQWFKSRCGIDLSETSREVSFCGHTILSNEPFVVEDALADPRFFDNPLVTGEPQIRFYAGISLVLPSGVPVGTLCVMDSVARTPSAQQLESLRELARLVEAWFERLESARGHGRSRTEIHARLTAVLGSMAEAVVFVNAAGRIISTNSVADHLPDTVFEVLGLREPAAAPARAVDENGVEIPPEQMPHRRALKDGVTQSRRIIGIVTSDASEPHWYEVSCEAIDLADRVIGVACSLLDVTDRQRVVQALLRSEHRLQAMAANVPGVIYQFRSYPDGRVRFEYISPGIERVYGIPAEQWMKDPEWVLDAIVEADKESYASAFIGAQATLSRFDWEGRTRTARPGQTIWIHCQSLPTIEPDGSILWNGVVSDVTSVKLQAEALRKSEERFRIVVEQTHQMIYDVDIITGETVWEGATWQLLGRTHQELSQMSLSGWFELVHPEDRQLVSEEVARSTAMDVPFSVRYRFRRSDGAYIWVHDRGIYVRGHRGKPIRMLGTLSDVTAEVNALRQSEESHGRAEALIAAIPDTVIRVAVDGTVVDVRHLPGWPMSTKLGQAQKVTLVDLLPKEIVDRCLKHVAQVVVSARADRFEIALDRDGRNNEYEVRLSPSGPREAVMVLRDTTEQRAVDRLKSQFVSTVSHELRTPLASIRGALGLMTAGIAGDLTPMLRELSELALDNTKRLERLINDLLDLESSDSGQLRLALGKHDLKPYLEKTVRSVTPFASTQGVAIRFETDVQSAPCWVDVDRFEQIVTNLLSNAIKYSGAETDVVLRLSATDEHWHIEVENTGTSIPESFRPRMFQRFAMADASDSRRRGGTGLGLAIAKALVERMDGRIDYASSGGTTRFFVDLPRKSTPSLRV
ncbi:MAG: PAS domain-containing protein [Polyangiaceae bacterium]